MKWLTRKWLIVIGFVVLLLFVMLAFCQTPVVIESAVVGRGQLTVTIDGEGKTRVREKFTITAPISGKMSRINLHQGDRVFKDFVITTIDPTPPERPVPPSKSDGSPDIYGVKVYAPVSGRILRVIEENERMIQAGTPLVEIGDLENLEIVVDVLSTEATQVQPGATMLIENWGGSEVLKGRVRLVEPEAFTKISALGVEEQRVNIIADLQEKTVKLGDNFRLDVRIIAWQSPDVLKVDSSALFRDGDKWKVFVNDRGTARLREVETGHQTPSETEILGGLSEGETVIIHPSNQIVDGTKVVSQ